MKKQFSSFLILSTLISVSAFATPARRGSVAVEERPIERPVIVEERPAGSTPSTTISPAVRTAPEARAAARGERAPRVAPITGRDTPLAPANDNARASGAGSASGTTAAPQVSSEMLAPQAAQPAAPRARRAAARGDSLYKIEDARELLSAEAIEAQDLAVSRFGQGPFNDLSCLRSWRSSLAKRNFIAAVSNPRVMAKLNDQRATKAQVVEAIAEETAQLTHTDAVGGATRIWTLANSPCRNYNRQFMARAGQIARQNGGSNNR
jgi:hypothetical protein